MVLSNSYLRWQCITFSNRDGLCASWSTAYGQLTVTKFVSARASLVIQLQITANIVDQRLHAFRSSKYSDSRPGFRMVSYTMASTPTATQPLLSIAFGMVMTHSPNHALIFYIATAFGVFLLYYASSATLRELSPAAWLVVGSWSSLPLRSLLRLDIYSLPYSVALPLQWAACVGDELSKLFASGSALSTPLCFSVIVKLGSGRLFSAAALFSLR